MSIEQVGLAVLGLVFGLAFPSGEFGRFAICFGSMIGSIYLAARFGL